MGGRVWLLFPVLALLTGGAPVRSAGGTSAGPDSFIGLVEPSRVLTLSFASDGQLSEVFVDRGDRVEIDQPIAELESRLEEVTTEIAQTRALATAALESARVRYEQLKAKRARIEELHGKGVSALDKLEEARWEERLGELALQQAQEELVIATLEYDRSREVLTRRRLLSPVQGVVLQRWVAAGEHVRVSDGTPIVRVVVLDPLYVEIFVPARLLGQLNVGQTAWIELQEGPANAPIEGTVQVLDPVVDAASGTFGVRLRVANPELRIAAGLRCHVRFRPNE